MKIRAMLCTAAACLWAVADANAVEITGLGTASYSHANGGVDGYGGAVVALFSDKDSGLKTQINGGYERASLDGAALDLANVSGEVFWRDKAGSIGASLGYNRLSADLNIFGYNLSGAANIQNYGGFGEWYASKWLTLQVKGGGFTGDATGGYGGAGFSVYPTRTIAWTGSYDYLSLTGIGDMSTLSTGLEYLPFPSLPVSLAVQYGHSWISGTTADTFGIAVKFRIGEGGPDLRSWDRTGPVQWNGGIAI